VRGKTTNTALGDNDEIDEGIVKVGESVASVDDVMCSEE